MQQCAVKLDLTTYKISTKKHENDKTTNGHCTREHAEKHGNNITSGVRIALDIQIHAHEVNASGVRLHCRIAFTV
jgi:hypothetical protein